MKPPFIRSAYNYDMDQVSEATGLKCTDKSLAQQEFAEESNINYIAERYGLTGELPHVINLPSYGNFEGVFDFQTAQNAVRQATEQFMELPAKLRARFHNSPQQLLEFLEDPENREEAIAIGLVKRHVEPPQDEPTKAKDVPGPKPEGETPTPKANGQEATPKT